MSKRNDEIIQAAIEGFEARKREINQQITELRGMLSGATADSASATPANGRRTMRTTPPADALEKLLALPAPSKKNPIG